MAKPLSDGQQRFFLGVLVFALVAFGIYLAWENFRDDESTPTAADDEPDDSTPSPMDVTDADDLDVFEWLPHSEDEFQDAALMAREFTEAFGTYDHTEDEDAYFDRMADHATDDFADTLTQTTGASALREGMAEEERVSTGHAEILELRDFDDDALVFVLDAQSIHENEDDTEESLGEFAVTMTEDGDEWQVYDFQPADAGDYGEEE